MFTRVNFYVDTCKRRRKILSMDDTQGISDAEWAVMELLWQSSPQGSTALCESLAKTKNWKRATVMTLLGRLVAKGIVRTDGEGKRWLYAAAIPRERCVTQKTRGFLDGLFKGALLPMVAHCIENEQVSAGEIESLQKLLAAAQAKKS
jgi:BlaI family penicillinase repressor